MAGRASNDPNDYFAIGVQAAKGTPASSFYFLKHLQGTAFDVAEQWQSDREGGSGQEVGLRYKTQVKIDGSAVAYSRPDITGLALALVLGQDVVTPATGGLVDHTLTPVASQPYFTAEQRWADQVERVSNGKVNQLDIEFEAGLPLKLTAAFLTAGPGAAGGSGMTPVRETSPPFYYPGASAVLSGGASGAKLTKGSFSLQRGLDDAIQTTDLFREDLVGQTQDYDFAGTVKFEDPTLWRKAHYADSAGAAGSQITAAIATMGFDLFAAQGSESVRLAQPVLQVTGAQPNRLDPDGKTIYVDLAALSIKSATYPFFGVVRSLATAPYTQGS